MKTKRKHWAWAKFGALVVFLTSAAIAVHALGAVNQFDAAWIQNRIDAAGWLAPIVYVVVYTLAVTLTLPGTILTVAGATLFPMAEAYGLVLIGAMSGASLSFIVGRLLGRDAIESLLSDTDHPILSRIQNVVNKFEDRGVVAVAYLRMAYVPFVLLNFFAPLTGIRFRDFFVGTLIGILPGSFVFVFMGNAFQVAWRSGEWEALFNGQTAIAVALFIASFALPHIVQRVVFPEEEPHQTQ